MTGYNTNQMMKNYSQLNTVPALVGILFAMASAVQFLDASITLGVISYTFTGQHAMVISLLSFVAAFAASDTKSFAHYAREEKALVAAAAGLTVGHQYVTQVSDFVANNSPVAGAAFFLISMTGWGILAR